MLRKVLVANRGEIALRVLNACRELGIRTVAVYSEADRNSLHVRFADEAICIGPPRAADSYLNVPAVISAAEIADVEAIHPGYGLLSENANFAEVCRASNIKFIGPPPEVTRLMGEKEKARQAMKKAKVPILPGSDGILSTAEEAQKWAEKVGYPVILKAKAGGGGRGMRIVRDSEDLPNLFHAAFTEAANAFGNGELYMEKFIENPRHIEFQMLADEHGNVVSLFERECSIQRRHQKLIEEAPSLQVTPKMREEIGRTLCRCLSEIGYQNAGTVEFLMDANHQLYFIEMNTRIQVEHPVTEAITGVDLVKGAVAHCRRRAAGRDSAAEAGDARARHRVPHQRRASAEVYAVGGQITAFNVPGGNGVRVETAQYAEGVIPPYYDSLIAKLITHGVDREEAIAKMERALSQFIVRRR
jgi:acetyl-CoA carboxylase, biotin carboxylase subunit